MKQLNTLLGKALIWMQIQMTSEAKSGLENVSMLFNHLINHKPINQNINLFFLFSQNR